MADPYESGIEISLKDFVENYPLPQTVKVVEGCYHEEEEFSNGCVILLNELVCRQVELTYFHPTRIQDKKTVTVSTNHPGTFKLVPLGKNNPYSPSPKPKLLVLQGIRDLVKFRPLYVKVLKPYKNPNNIIAEKDDRLQLIRTVARLGTKYLECKSLKRNKLLYLDSNDEEGEFEEVQASHYVTLADLIQTLPAMRRMHISKDMVNIHNPIENVPHDTSLVIVLEQPSMNVSISPQHSKGAHHVVSMDLDITVSPRQDLYESRLEVGSLLYDFANDNYYNFPITATIVNWYDVSMIVENHMLRPGMHICLQKHTEIGKFAAHDIEDNHYAIPEDYRVKFQLVPRSFRCVDELKKEVGARYRALSDCMLEDWPSEEYSLVSGEVFAVEANEVHLIKDSNLNQEIEGIKVKCEKGQTIKYLPLALRGTYEEVYPDDKILDFDDIRGHAFPIVVKFTSRAHDHPHQYDPIPEGKIVTLDYYLKEPCVEVTKEYHNLYTKFNLPLRSQILLMACKHKVKHSYPKKLSPVDMCPELITKRIHKELEEYNDPYELADEPAPVLPLRDPIRRSQSEPKPPEPPPRTPSRSATLPVPAPRKSKKLAGGQVSQPPPRPKKSAALESSSKGVKSHGRPKPPAPRPITVCDYEVPISLDVEYEDVEQLHSAMQDSAIPIPVDGNLSKLSAEEMAAFLRMNKVEDGIVRRCNAAKIDGKRFGQMSEADINKYHLDKYPMVLHFKGLTVVKGMDVL